MFIEPMTALSAVEKNKNTFFSNRITLEKKFEEKKHLKAFLYARLLLCRSH